MTNRSRRLQVKRRGRVANASSCEAKESESQSESFCEEGARFRRFTHCRRRCMQLAAVKSTAGTKTCAECRVHSTKEKAWSRCPYTNCHVMGTKPIRAKAGGLLAPMWDDIDPDH